MKAYQRVALLLLLLRSATGLIARGEGEERRSATAEEAAQRLREQIVSEIKQLSPHDWAGDYYAGDGLGVNMSLVLAPNSGYVFEWHGCLGLYDRNYGPVRWSNGRIRLSFTFENSRRGFQGIASELIPVRWGERRYLVPADDVVGFCNNVNAGSEPRTKPHGFYLLRRGDEEKKVRGWPNVPREYQQYLLSKPVEATIIAVGSYSTRPSVVDWRFKETLVTLDAGTKHGLHSGMELIVTKPLNRTESVRITKVENKRSEAIMIQIGDEGPGPSVGWRLCTQAPWRTQKTR